MVQLGLFFNAYSLYLEFLKDELKQILHFVQSLASDLLKSVTLGVHIRKLGSSVSVY